MPEQVAAVKLRGFLDSVGGDVIETIPGLIRVRLGWRRVAAAPEPTRRRWPWSGFRKAAPPATIEQAQMDVALERPAANEPSRLLLTVQLRPAAGTPPQEDTEWHTWCDRLQRNLKAYLMAEARPAPKPASPSNLSDSTPPIVPTANGTADPAESASAGASSAIAQSLV